MPRTEPATPTRSARVQVKQIIPIPHTAKERRTMKTLTAALSSAAATLWLVATASAWPTPTAQQRAACQNACEDQLHQCISNAKDARNTCRASCQPMQTARQQACANG